MRTPGEEAVPGVSHPGVTHSGKLDPEKIGPEQIDPEKIDPEKIDTGDPRSFRTADAQEARFRTREFLGCSHRMTVLDRDRPFLARVQYRSVGGIGLLSSVYGAAVEIGCAPPIDKVTVN